MWGVADVAVVAVVVGAPAIAARQVRGRYEQWHTLDAITHLLSRAGDSIADLLLLHVHTAIMDGLIAAAAEGGHAAVRDLPDHLLVRYGRDEAFDERQQACS